MQNRDAQQVPPHRRPTLVVAVIATAAAIAVGLIGDDERLLLIPAALGLLWAAAYRAHASESLRSRRAPQGSIVVRRNPTPEPRRRNEMPPTSSGHSPSAVVGATRVVDKTLVKRVAHGMPLALSREGKAKKKMRRGGGDEGPNLGL